MEIPYPNQNNLPVQPRPKNKKLVFLIIIIVVVLVVTIGLIFLLKSKASKNNNIKSSLKKEVVTNIQKDDKIDEKEEVVDLIDKAIENTAKVDQDFDGIWDKDEAKYKTSPTSADTDNDGINDGDEINIYKTDPLKKDTDGDGYTDGDEVNRGYNPKGEGNLQQKSL